MSMTYSYSCVYALRAPSAQSGRLPQVHVVEHEHSGGHSWAQVRTLCDVQAGSRPRGDVQDWSNPNLATCPRCRKLWTLICSVQEGDCPGSGRPWTASVRGPICRVCHIGPGGLGIGTPRLKGVTYGWKGRVPRHVHQERARS